MATVQMRMNDKAARQFGSALVFLSKNGKDIVLEATPEAVILRTLNDAKNAFAAVHFNRGRLLEKERSEMRAVTSFVLVHQIFLMTIDSPLLHKSQNSWPRLGWRGVSQRVAGRVSSLPHPRPHVRASAVRYSSLSLRQGGRVSSDLLCRAESHTLSCLSVQVSARRDPHSQHAV